MSETPVFSGDRRLCPLRSGLNSLICHSLVQTWTAQTRWHDSIDPKLLQKSMPDLNSSLGIVSAMLMAANYFYVYELDA